MSRLSCHLAGSSLEETPLPVRTLGVGGRGMPQPTDTEQLTRVDELQLRSLPSLVLRDLLLHLSNLEGNFRQQNSSSLVFPQRKRGSKKECSVGDAC